MNTTKKDNRYSFGFIVSFLNEAIWLEYFIRYYVPILEMNPDNKMIFVEGATSFHSEAEHRRGLSVDGSEEIISRMKINSMIHLRKGRVGVLAELLNEGLAQCNRQDFIIPLSAHDFISDNFFLIQDEIPLLTQLSRTELVGDFRHMGFQLPTLPIIHNMESLYFRHNDLIPYYDNTRLDKDENGKHLDFPVINISKIETKFQFERRMQRQRRINEWYHKKITPLNQAVIDYTTEKDKRDKAKQYTGFMPEVLKAHEWYGKTADEIWHIETIFPRFRQSQIGALKSGKKILDIGCATGHTMKYYQKRGWQAVGIEPSLWASGYGKHILNLDMRTGMVLDFSFPKDEFTVIAFWDSFEHIAQPIETLQHLKDWLEENGKLTIYTPNFDKFKDDKKHYLWSPRQHFFLYTPETLQKMLEQVGFQVISIDRQIGENAFLLVAQKAGK